jgi:hypothetical protein
MQNEGDESTNAIRQIDITFVSMCPLGMGLYRRTGSNVLTKMKQPELHRYWTTRDRAAGSSAWRRRSWPPSRRAIPAPGRLALPGLPGAESVLGVGLTRLRPTYPNTSRRPLPEQ